MIEIGQKVRIHYVGKLDGGCEFDNTYTREEPIEFVVGSRSIFPELEKSVTEMEPGEKRSVFIQAKDAYGLYDESMIEKVPADSVPNADLLPVGKYIQIAAPSGPINVKVSKIEDESIYFDHNHVLAGKDLTFEVELIDVVHESAVEHEKHSPGCGCGCDKLKAALKSQ